ncbi:MAG TPA: hypothetical protein VFA55_05305, partial [Candidatus Kapabacteria bacterium]|nr:hypothetical protein [Candidatus Kapabacteria bacterium]
DLGADVTGITHSDKGTLTLKAAARYQLATYARLEAGIGAADDSYGKSLNGDLALTVGTRNELSPWNFYTSLRLMRAQGYPGNILNGGSANDSGAPPNTSFILVNLGTTARISQNQKFFFEGGYGYIFPDHQASGPGLFIGAGMLFDIGM